MAGFRDVRSGIARVEWMLNWVMFFTARVVCHVLITYKLVIDAPKFGRGIELPLALFGMFGMNLLNFFLGLDLFRAYKRERNQQRHWDWRYYYSYDYVFMKAWSQTVYLLIETVLIDLHLRSPCNTCNTSPARCPYRDVVPLLQFILWLGLVIHTQQILPSLYVKPVIEEKYLLWLLLLLLLILYRKLMAFLRILSMEGTICTKTKSYAALSIQQVKYLYIRLQLGSQFATVSLELRRTVSLELRRL